MGPDSNLLIRKVKMISLFVFFGSIVTGDSIIFRLFFGVSIIIIQLVFSNII